MALRHFCLEFLMRRVLPFLFLFLSAPAFAQTGLGGIIDTEHEFAQKTKDTNYAEGFLSYADRNAVWFNPNPRNAFNELTEMANSSDSKNPSQLRWYPNFVGISSSDDFGFDLGAYYIENSDKSGLFFTIWQKDDQGKWRYTLDTGAASFSNISQMPKDGNYIQLKPSSNVPSKNIFDFDENINDQLSKTGAKEAFEKFADNKTIILTENMPPSNFGGDKNALIASRPSGDWEFSGVQMSSARDLIATFGNVKNGDKALGEYVRLWQWQGNKYQLIIDIYKPRAE